MRLILVIGIRWQTEAWSVCQVERLSAKLCMTLPNDRKFLEDREIEVLVTRPIHLSLGASKRGKIRLPNRRNYRRIFEGSRIVVTRNPFSVFGYARNYDSVGAITRSCANLTPDRLRNTAIQRKDSVDAPTPKDGLSRTLQVT